MYNRRKPRVQKNNLNDQLAICLLNKFDNT